MRESEIKLRVQLDDQNIPEKIYWNATDKEQGGEEEIFFVSGGYLEVQPNLVTVLSDTAQRADDVDEAAALEAKQEAERLLANQSGDFDYSRAAAQLAEAAARLRVIQQLRNKH